MPGPNDGFLARAQVYLIRVNLLYIVILGLLCVPIVQRHAVYLHALRVPIFADFDDPPKYGLPLHRTVNVKIDTPDKERLGAWLVLPETSTNSNATLLPPRPPSEADIRDSLLTRPTILYFHGNGATRAMSARVRYCTTYTRAFGANVLAIDYRGFADSSGVPSKEGLVTDARAALDWVVARGANVEDVLIVGLSLGTGVVSALGAELAREGIHPKGIVLLAPFTSIQSVLLDYHVFGIMPVLQPLQIFPFLTKFIAGFYNQHFDTQAVIQDIHAPLLIIHSRNDWDIPHTHSQRLFTHLLEPFLSPVPVLPKTPQEVQKVDCNAHNDALSKRRATRDAIVHTQVIDRFGEISRFRRPEGQEVVFVETIWGGHNLIGLQDSVVDIIGTLFGYSPAK